MKKDRNRFGWDDPGLIEIESLPDQAVELKHYPGGQDHDQQSHAGGGVPDGWTSEKTTTNEFTEAQINEAAKGKRYSRGDFNEVMAHAAKNSLQKGSTVFVTSCYSGYEISLEMPKAQTAMFLVHTQKDGAKVKVTITKIRRSFDGPAKKGGEGSGNFGHGGRPGMVGGSTPGDGGTGSIDEDILQLVNEGDEELVTSDDTASRDEWTKGLSQRQQAAVNAYRDEGMAQKINAFARFGGRPMSTEAKYMSNLESALEKQRLPDGEVLYRGMEVHPEDMGEMKGMIRQGGEFTDNGFVSMSRSSVVSGNFLVGGEKENKRLFFKLRTSGAKGVFIAKNDNLPEHLLQRGAKIRIQNVKEFDSGLIFIEGTIGHG
jgi:hypothetical protein